jgi:hypothetical protein
VRSWGGAGAGVVARAVVGRSPPAGRVRAIVGCYTRRAVAAPRSPPLAAPGRPPTVGGIDVAAALVVGGAAAGVRRAAAVGGALGGRGASAA